MHVKSYGYHTGSLIEVQLLRTFSDITRKPCFACSTDCVLTRSANPSKILVALACFAKFSSKRTRRPPVEALKTSFYWSFQSTACFEGKNWNFRYLTPTYSRYISFGNMQSVAVGFVFYAEVVFYMPHLSVKASKFNSQDSIPSSCKLVNILVSWQRNDASTLILSVEQNIEQNEIYNSYMIFWSL